MTMNGDGEGPAIPAIYAQDVCICPRAVYEALVGAAVMAAAVLQAAGDGPVGEDTVMAIAIEHGVVVETSREGDESTVGLSPHLLSVLDFVAAADVEDQISEALADDAPVREEVSA